MILNPLNCYAFPLEEADKDKVEEVQVLSVSDQYDIAIHTAIILMKPEHIRSAEECDYLRALAECYKAFHANRTSLKLEAVYGLASGTLSFGGMETSSATEPKSEAIPPHSSEAAFIAAIQKEVLDAIHVRSASVDNISPENQYAIASRSAEIFMKDPGDRTAAESAYVDALNEYCSRLESAGLGQPDWIARHTLLSGTMLFATSQAHQSEDDRAYVNEVSRQ